MRSFKVLAVLCCLGVVALAAPSDMDLASVETNEIEPSSSWERFARMLSGCASGQDDVASCLAIKGVAAVNRAARMQEVQLFSGVQFQRDLDAQARDGKSLQSESELSSSLPSDPMERAGRLLSLATEAASGFLKGHTLQVKVAPEEVTSAARAFNEARGKLKKLLGPILLGVGVKVLAIVAIFGGGLALLVTKALIVAKLAFVLASVLGLSRLLSGGGSGGLFNKGSTGGGASQQQGWSNSGAQTGGWSSGGGGSGASWNNGGASAAYPYARSYETQEAQELAYAAQKQQ